MGQTRTWYGQQLCLDAVLENESEIVPQSACLYTVATWVYRATYRWHPKRRPLSIYQHCYRS